VLRVCEAHYKGVVGIFPWQVCLLFCLWRVSLFTAFCYYLRHQQGISKKEAITWVDYTAHGWGERNFSFPLPKMSPSDAPLNQHAVSTVHYEGWMTMVSCQQTRFC
jgi:hypothetical protein